MRLSTTARRPGPGSHDPGLGPTVLSRLRRVEAVPYVKFADFDDHGYLIVDVTPERVRGEWCS